MRGLTIKDLSINYFRGKNLGQTFLSVKGIEKRGAVSAFGYIVHYYILFYSHAFSEIARLVNIETLGNSHMIAEQL